MKNLNYLMDYIRYEMFKIILNISYKTWGKTVDSLINIFVNKIESRIMFKINTGYYLEILTPETIKLVKSLKVK